MWEKFTDISEDCCFYSRDKRTDPPHMLLKVYQDTNHAIRKGYFLFKIIFFLKGKLVFYENNIIHFNIIIFDL